MFEIAIDLMFRILAYEKKIIESELFDSMSGAGCMLSKNIFLVISPPRFEEE